MKIKNIKKEKNNLYKITLSDNTSLSFYDDIIIKYNLWNNKELSKNDIDVIIKDNINIEAYYKAIKYITVKLRTKKEITTYLNKYKYSNDIINKVIEKLEKEGYLNNDLYIKSYINDQINLTLNGPIKIINNLCKLGFKKEDITKYIYNISDDIWLEKIDKIINKKVNSNHNLSNKVLLQKISNYLITEGFYKEQINEKLQLIVLKEDNSILKKEFDKLYIKLSRKYSNEELLYKIKNNLIRKGFDISDINNLIDNCK